jgi:hypothetical protein
LATVDLGLLFQPGTTPGHVNVFLYGDAAGSPDNADQTLLGSTTATTFPGLASFTVSGNVSVTMGSVYWLVLKPADVNQHTAWMNSLPQVTGGKDFSRDDVTWEFFPNNILEAFRITAQGPTVPDSGSTLLFMLVLIPALLVLQHWPSRRLP